MDSLWILRKRLPIFYPKEPEDYDDEEGEEEEEEEEMHPTKKTFKLKTWRPDSSYPGGGDSKGSSDLFRKFASKNAGGSFRDMILSLLMFSSLRENV